MERQALRDAVMRYNAEVPQGMHDQPHPGPRERDMPLVVEMSVAFAVLVAFLIFGIFFFRIRERFDSLDVERLDQARGERR